MSKNMCRMTGLILMIVSVFPMAGIPSGRDRAPDHRYSVLQNTQKRLETGLYFHAALHRVKI